MDQERGDCTKERKKKNNVKKEDLLFFHKEIERVCVKGHESL